MIAICAACVDDPVAAKAWLALLAVGGGVGAGVIWVVKRTASRSIKIVPQAQIVEGPPDQ
jgi:hypothetical protein